MGLIKFEQDSHQCSLDFLLTLNICINSNVYCTQTVLKRWISMLITSLPRLNHETTCFLNIYTYIPNVIEYKIKCISCIRRANMTLGYFTEVVGNGGLYILFHTIRGWPSDKQPMGSQWLIARFSEKLICYQQYQQHDYNLALLNINNYQY